MPAAVVAAAADTVVTDGRGVSQHHVADVPGRPEGVDVRLRLAAEHRGERQRILDAADRILRAFSEWFGPYPYETLTIVDVPWKSGADDAPARGGTVMLRTRWLLAPGSPHPQSEVAAALARQWWADVTDRALAEELIVYSRDRAVDRLFADDPGHNGSRGGEMRFFGDFIPWRSSLRTLDRDTAIRSTVGRRLLTLERYIGWPALQRALATVVKGGVESASRATFFDIVSAAAGQDLSWFERAAFEAGAIDYAVDDLTTVAVGDCAVERCFHTKVAVRRRGAPFTGSSRPPVGGYESGRAIVIRTGFANGTSVDATWDGRAEVKEIGYESRAAAVWAQVDPEHVLALDASGINNSRTAGGRGSAPARWAARWLVWLQDAIVSYAALV